MVSPFIEKKVTREDLLEGARRIGELAEKEAREAEINSTISENVVNLIKETQISRIMLPKEYGGPQTDLKHLPKSFERFLITMYQQDG